MNAPLRDRTSLVNPEAAFPRVVRSLGEGRGFALRVNVTCPRIADRFPPFFFFFSGRHEFGRRVRPLMNGCVRRSRTRAHTQIRLVSVHAQVCRKRGVEWTALEECAIMSRRWNMLFKRELLFDVRMII